MDNTALTAENLSHLRERSDVASIHHNELVAEIISNGSNSFNNISSIHEFKIDHYETYKRKSANEIYAIVKFSGPSYPRNVPSGAVSAIFDHSYGILLTACNLPEAFTASLNVNFRSLPPFP